MNSTTGVCARERVRSYTLSQSHTHSRNVYYSRHINQSRHRVSVAKEPYKRDYILQKRPILVKPIIFMSPTITHSLSHTLSHTLSLTHSLSHTHSHSVTLSLSMANERVEYCRARSLTHSLSYSRSQPLYLSHTLSQPHPLSHNGNSAPRVHHALSHTHFLTVTHPRAQWPLSA